MSEKKIASLQEVLQRLNNARMAKHAEEDLEPGVADADEEVNGKSEVGTEVAAPDVDNVENNITDIKERNEADVEVVIDDSDDAISDTLSDIAKEAAEHHNETLMKEAALFGQLFADSAFERMTKQAEEAQYNAMLNATAEEAYNIMMGKFAALQEEAIFKQAAEEAYEATLNKLAEGEAAPMPPQGGMPLPPPYPEEPAPEAPAAPDLNQAAKAVSDAASAAEAAADAAKSLAEAFQGAAGGEEAVPQEDYNAAVQEAYDQAMAQMNAPQQVQDPQAAQQQAMAQAQQDAYMQAMQQMQAQQGGMPMQQPMAEQAPTTYPQQGMPYPQQ